MKKTKKLSLQTRQKIIGWLFIMPAVLLLLWMVFIPAAEAVYTSFRTGNGTHMRWAGFKNYRRMLHDKQLLTAIKNTLIYAAWQVPIMLTLAMFFAAVLNNNHLKYRPVFRTMIFLPCTMSLVAYAIVFKVMTSTGGIVNGVLLHLGLINSAINFLGNGFLAKVVLIVSLIWRWTGYNMIFYVTGLTNIDYQLYESAQIDGATWFQSFRKITIPMLKPVILLTIVMATNGNLQLFDETYNMTEGGPGNATITISQYIYEQAFSSVANFGYAAAIGFALMLVIVVLVMIQMKVGDADD